jgi:phosphodiesterase/alkaline phosphatase D-like protein
MSAEMTGRLDRRAFLRGAAGSAASLSIGGVGLGCGRDVGPTRPAAEGWDSGEVAHLLPTANHRRIRLKASFLVPQKAPRLRVGDRTSAGIATDSEGFFYTFDVDDLEPATEHRLQLERESGEALCEAWPLRTLPAPGQSPERLRLLVYTCAGGPDNLYNFGFFDAYVPIRVRQRLLARALSFGPDAVVANGDHVYWDIQSRFGWAMGRSWRAGWVAGHFDRSRPILGTENEGVLKRAFGPQIAGLYGVLFRSVPTYFIVDDHDYGENDEASDALRTFPPDTFMLDTARTTQRLYYPELLADATLPGEFVNRERVSESFGRLRYGDLFEALLYDCRRYFHNTRDPALGHRDSAFLPPAIERWIQRRIRKSDAAHLAQMPSTPVLWSAGKWGEWYPDFKDEAGVLRADVAKPYWAQGWADQHDRLITAASSRSDRTPLFVSGDLHAIAVGRILANRGESLKRNPVVSVLAGPIGTGALGWPSRFRGQVPIPSGVLEAEELIAPIEENGFSLLDVTPRELTVSSFRWTPDQGEETIDRLEPFEVTRFARPGSS